MIEGPHSAPPTCLGPAELLRSPSAAKLFSKQFQAAASPLTKIFTRL